MAALCFVLLSLQLSVCLWWHDYRRDDFPTLEFRVVMADLLAIDLRQSLPAAGIIEESERARGEGGRVG